MKTLILTIALLFSASSFAINCESAAEAAASEKYTNREYACYGRATVIEIVNANTMKVLVDNIGGSQACRKKLYNVTFKVSGRSCSILAVQDVGGLGGI